MSSTCNLSDFESVLIGTTTNLLIDPGLDIVGSHSLGGGTHFSHLNHNSNTIPDVTLYSNGNQLDMDMHILNDVADMPPNTVMDGVELPGHFYGGVGELDVLNNLKPQNLMDELASSGVNYNPDDVIVVTKTVDDKLVWLENGTDAAGLNHIITEHADDFLNKGITQEQIPDYVMNALKNGEIVGYQGRGTGRPIYEFTYNGEIHKVAITVGNNGFVVGANPK